MSGRPPTTAHGAMAGGPTAHGPTAHGPTADPAAQLLPPSEPASLARSVAALLAMELRLTTRRYENLLVMFGLPPLLLVFLAVVPIRGAVGGGSAGDAVGALLGPIVAIAVAAAGFVNLGIATAYERAYGVLKRLGGAPLPVGGLVLAKVVAVGVVVVGQLALLGVVALALGWRPSPSASLPLLVGGLGLGLVAFASLGLLFGGTLRAEAALAVVNGLFLVFLLLGGVIVPVEALPGALRNLAELAPVTALARVVEAALEGPTAVGPSGAAAVFPDLVSLGLWAAVGALAARSGFRWE